MASPHGSMVRSVERLSRMRSVSLPVTLGAVFLGWSGSGCHELSDPTELASTQAVLTDSSLLRPILECVTADGPSQYTAHFGYLNTVTDSVSVPVGANNKFTPSPLDRAQPTLFAPGRHVDVFTVAFNGANLVWKLGPRTSTASSTSTRCPTNAAPSVTATATPSTAAVSADVLLAATATDDGLPSGATLSYAWTFVSGPGVVDFVSPSASATSAFFRAAGSYVVRVTVSDSLLSASANVPVTITAPVGPTVSVSNVTLAEGNSGLSNAIFSVSLSAATNHEVTVAAQTADGTAIAGCDYLRRGAVLTFAPGETVRTFAVPVLGDLVPEPDKQFLVNLGDVIGATLGQGSATGLIIDEDDPNEAPSVPSARAPSLGSSGLPAATTLAWTSTDPENQPLTFDVQLGSSLTTDGQAWQAQCGASSAPAGRAFAASAYDDATDRAFIFGGQVAAGQTADVWVLHNATTVGQGAVWQAVSPAGAALSARKFAVAGFDESAQVLVVHGGCTGSCTSSLHDTKVITGLGTSGTPAWVSLPASPVALREHAAAYDQVSHKLIVFGGIPEAATSPTNDLWVLNNVAGGGTPTWQPLAASGTRPPARASAAVAYDGAADRLYVFGGRSATGTVLSDVWVLSGATGRSGSPAWQKLNVNGTGPAGRWGHSLSLEPVAGRLLVHGGSSGVTGSESIGLKDSWLLNLGGTAPAWTRVAASTEAAPAQRLGHVAAYSANRNRLLLFGGLDSQASATPKADLWSMSNAIGTLATVATNAASSHFGATSLTDNTRYLWRVVARDSQGAENGGRLFDLATGDPTLTVNDVSVVEDSASPLKAVFHLRLSAPSVHAVTVNYATEDGTATAGSDYVAASGTATIAAGALETTVEVTINSDFEVEANETVSLVLSSAAGATVARERSTAVIVDDDNFMNAAPVVNAGPDQVVPGWNTVLHGFVRDDGRPAGQPLTVKWNVIQKPSDASVAVDDPSSENTRVIFPEPGGYVFRLEGSDGEYSASDVVVIIVQAVDAPPTVNAGPDQSVLGPVVSLHGEASDDASSVVTEWSLVSGPGSVAFGDLQLPATTATFTASGVYELRLTASDGHAVATDDVQITIGDANNPPLVDAGLDAHTFIAGSSPKGRIVVNVDEWTLSTSAFTPGSTVATFAENLARFLANKPFGNFLVYSDNFGLVQPELAATMTNAGHTWTINRALEPTLANLAPYDAIFLAVEDVIPPEILKAYVDGGGSVYLATGTQTVGTPEYEARLWNPFLTSFGIRLGGIDRFRDAPAVSHLSLTHPLLLGVSSLLFYGSNLVRAVTDGDPWVTLARVENDPEPGARLAIFEAIAGGMVTLNGAVKDDGLPAGAELTVQWSQVSGPSTASIEYPSTLVTRARFSQPGTYVLRLSASDGQLSGQDDVVVVVAPSSNPPPVVDAGVDQTISLPNFSAHLAGSALDDQPLSVEWTFASGPSVPILANPRELETDVLFRSAGQYLFRLSVSDGASVSTDMVTVIVNASTSSDQPPVVEAGDPQTLVIGANRAINGGAELPLAGTSIPGWVAQQGSWSVVMKGDALRGSSVFQAPTSDSAALMQDVYIGNEAALVDTALFDVNVSVGMRTKAEALPDLARIEVQYRGQNNTSILGATFSPFLGFTSGWGRHRVTGRIPQGTHFLRVIVRTFRQTGALNDVEIDDIDVSLSGVGTLLKGYALDDNLTPQQWWTVTPEVGLRIGDPSAQSTNVAFTLPGVYDFQLNANDSVTTVSDSVRITVLKANEAPVVQLGPDRLVRLSQTPLELSASVSDDGAPSTAVSLRWSQVEGPATASFSEVASATTLVSFSTPGTYRFQVSADDGERGGVDDINILVVPTEAPNRAPLVSAGPDRQLNWPQNTVTLAGVSTDDGLPLGATTVATWSQVAGPGGATLAQEGTFTAAATLPSPGVYVFNLTVTDGEFSSSDEVMVVASAQGQNAVPTVSAGPDSVVIAEKSIVGFLHGSIVDDGFPFGTTSVGWQQISGPPGAVIFDTQSADTAVLLSGVVGTYVFMLTGTDGAAIDSDTATIRVVGGNLPPVVDAGPDQTALAPTPGFVTLTGTATDDGVTLQPLTYQWSMVAGPAPAVIATPNQASTQVSFVTPGTYVLTLVVGDGDENGQDTVTVVVQPSNVAPVVDAGPARTALLPNRTVSLAGTISDDGKPAGSTPVARWSLVSGPGPVVFANALSAATTATFQEVGSYTLRLTAHDGQLSAFDDTQVVVSGQTATGAAPTVAFSAPVDLSVVTAPTNLEGSVASATLSAWRLEMRPTTPDAEWTTFAKGSTQLSGVLAKFDPTLLENGIYDIRLAATDTAGRSAEALMQLLVKDQMKLGHVALTFEDLNVPMAGVPIQILRSYDSRNTQKGDFGHGWTLDVNRVRVYENAVLGKSFGAGSTGGFLPRYCVQPARKLVVTVITPDGRMHEFEPTVSDACQYFSPPDFVTIGFAAKPGTNSTLELVSGGDVTVLPGESGGYELWSGSDGDYEPFDPRRYRLTLQDGRVLEFDQFDGFTRIADRNGNSLTFDAHGITHSSGKSITFERDEENRITESVDPMGQRNAYRYDPDGNLASFTDREGNETKFTYDSQRIHHLRDIIDARGVRAIRHGYDSDGRLISTTDSLGHAISLSHDLDNRKETVIDRNGYTKTLWFDDRGNVVREVDGEGHETLRTYNSLNNVLSETDGSGRTRQYEYDTRDNVTAEVDALGHRTEHTYNEFGQVLTTTDALGHVTTSTYSAQGNLLTQVGPRPGETTSYLYDFLGNMRQMTDALGHVSNYAHDDQGNKTSETDALGHVTTYTYDANNRPLTEVRTRTTGTGTETLTTTHTYDGQGRETRVVQPDGSQMQYAYDAVGNRVTSTDALGHVTTTTYDTNGRATRVTYQDGTFDQTAYDNEGRAVSRTDRAGQVTSSTFDKVGRLVRTTRPDGTYSESTYDGAGRVVASFQSGRGTTTFVYDATGQQTSSTDASGAVASTGYDVAGRKVSETNALSGVTQLTLDEEGNATLVTNPGGSTRSSVFDFLGREVSQTDERGKTTTYAYDELGRLESVTDPRLNVTRYAYDEVGNRIATTDAANHTTHYEYDRVGRETKRVLPDGAFELRTYDAGGNVASRQDFEGRVTTYAYDVKNRQTLRTYPDSTTVAFTYNAMGRRLTATNATGATAYEYDTSQRLLRKTDPAGRKVEYTYDSAGRQATLTAKVGAEVFTTTYGYDGAGRMVGVTDPAGRAFTMSHDAAGMLATLVRPNGVQTSYTHDNRARLTNIRTFKVVGNTTIASYAYTLGASGLRDAITEADGTVRAYAYDDVGRLVGEGVSGGSGPQYTKTFAYDAVSNRSSQVTTGTAAANVAYSYDERQRLLTENAQPYVWDVNGNQTQRPTGDAYQWDFEDRLVKVTKADGSVVQNTYDADGVLVRTSVTPSGGGAAVVTDLVVDTHGGLSHIVAEVGGSGAVSAVYVRAGDMLLEEIRAGVPRYFEAEGIGSVRSLLNTSGVVTDTWRYTAFGEELTHTGTGANPYRFAGERYVGEVGLYQNRARWLDTGRGAFVISDHGPPTGYRYSHADPVNFADPTGYLEAGIGGIMTTMVVGAAIGAGAAYYGNMAGNQVQTLDSIAFGAAVGAFSGGVAAVSVVGAAALAGLGVVAIKDLPMVVLNERLPYPQRLAAFGLMAAALWGSANASSLVAQATPASLAKLAEPEMGIVRMNPKDLLPRQGPTEMTPEVVQSMSEDMMVNRFNWERSGPIEVYEKDGVYIIKDGHHRTAAAIEAWETSVPVRVVRVSSEADWTARLLEVYEANGMR